MIKFCNPICIPDGVCNPVRDTKICLFNDVIISTTQPSPFQGNQL